MKKEPYVKVNPNGRVPAIEDPNTGISLWESGAINEYLVDQYDKEGKVSAPVPSKPMSDFAGVSFNSGCLETC